MLALDIAGLTRPELRDAIFLPERQFQAKAVLLGERIDLRGYAADEVLARNPLTVSVGNRGVAVLFRYGAVVMFGVSEPAQSKFLETLARLIGERHERPETEEVEVRVDPGFHEGVQGSVV